MRGVRWYDSTLSFPLSDPRVYCLRNHTRTFGVSHSGKRSADRVQHEPQRAIRDFLKVRTSYDVLPLSFRLIVFDTALSIKESLNILVQNGASQLVATSYSRTVSDHLTGIVSAPLWDSRTSTFAGLLTTSDYINVIQYYWQNPTKLSEIDGFTLSNLRGRYSIPWTIPRLT